MTRLRTVSLTRNRVPAFAIGALGLFTLATLTLPRITAPAAPESRLYQTAVSLSRPATLAQRPLAITPATVSSTTCDPGAYVSGDLAGDASPASIYATMCGPR